MVVSVLPSIFRFLTSGDVFAPLFVLLHYFLASFVERKVQQHRLAEFPTRVNFYLNVKWLLYPSEFFIILDPDVVDPTPHVVLHLLLMFI